MHRSSRFDLQTSLGRLRCDDATIAQMGRGHARHGKRRRSVAARGNRTRPKPVAYDAWSLLPVIPIEAAVLHRLREMFRAYPLGVIQIRDRAGDFQDAIVRAGR